MKPEEKILIESLFNRLKKVEEKYPNRNKSANEFITNLVKKQPNSIYYIAQTTLIQEVAIKKLNDRILELEKKILELESMMNKKEPGFLSSFFGNKNTESIYQSQNNFPDKTVMAHSNNNIDNVGTLTPFFKNNNGTSSFITNALQTAAGVAGGVVMGNMLMNLFHKDKPEEEIFNTVQEDTKFSSLEDYNLNDNQFFLNSENDLMHHTSSDYKYNDEYSQNNVENNIVQNDDPITFNPENEDNSFDSDFDDENFI